MKYEHLYTTDDSAHMHISHLTSENGLNLTPCCELKVYGIPAEWSDEECIAALEDTSRGVELGVLKGFLILGSAIEKAGRDMYDVCDAQDGELEFIVSALQEHDGPLSEAAFGDTLDVFYIESITLSDPEALPTLLEELPEIVLTHMHVKPDILCFYPAPLPHEKSRLDQLKEELAMIAFADAMQAEEGKPHLVLSEEQLNIVMGRRNAGASYPEEYADPQQWVPFLNAGFREWRRTRVLYKIVEE